MGGRGRFARNGGGLRSRGGGEEGGSCRSIPTPGEFRRRYTGNERGSVVHIWKVALAPHFLFPARPSISF